MFNLAAPTLPLPGGALADLMTPGGAKPAETAGFADVLALQDRMIAAAPAPAAPVADPSLPAIAANEAAIRLPATGKILPVLPAVIAAVPANAQGAAEVPAQPAEPQPAVLPIQFATAPLPRATATRITPRNVPQPEVLAEDTGEDIQPVAAKTEAVPEFAVQVLPLMQAAQQAAIAAAPQPVAAQPATEQSDPQQHSAARPISAQALPLSPRAEAPVPVVGQPVMAPTIPTVPFIQNALQVIEIDPAKTAPRQAAEAAQAVQAPLLAEMAPAALGTPVARLRTQRPVEPGQVKASADSAQPLAALSAPVLADPAPAALTATPRAERPVDFAQLVDRLTAAREMASPQPVHVALNHAEFGKVSLRFESDNGALNVALSSPDPEFARAVAAAAPAQQGASTGSSDQQAAQSFQQQTGPQSPSGQAASQQQNSPQQSRAEARGAERAQTRNPAPNNGDEQAPARRGLFA